mmetsp:Transcript_133354/g.414683  ORF Transcript_133354/g.414683 Transcript_133354/m.414683 type:complete len:281 (-) Transcript_133354:268-1110(-)
MSCKSSTLWIIWAKSSSCRASDLSPLTGACFMSTAESIALRRCFRRHEESARVKSCSMAIWMTPTWPSLTSFSSNARLRRCSSSWFSARCRSRVTWHSCSRLLIMRCSFCSFVCTRRHSSRARSRRSVSAPLAWCSSRLPASRVLCRFIRTSMSPSKSSSHSWTTAARNCLYFESWAIFFCSAAFSASCSSCSCSLTRISLSKFRHSICSSRDFFSPFSIFASNSCNDFSFSMTCRLSSVCLLTKSSSRSRQACNRSSTPARVASSALPASLSLLSIFRS